MPRPWGEDMSRALIVIDTPESRIRASNLAMRVPTGTRIEFRGPRRTLEQNDKMWAALTDVAQQKQHAGRRYTTDEWKALFMHALGREMKFLLSLDGQTFVPYGHRSSELTKAEMSELIELITAWGTQNGVVFHDETPGISDQSEISSMGTV
jgi:NinB protein